MDMQELIAKLEAAEGPCMELDEEIARQERWREWQTCWMSPDGRIRQTDAPRYTASFDAALMLLPEGWEIYAITDFPPTHNSGQNWLIQILDRENWKDLAVFAKALPIALCIAALKARGVGNG